ncbi:response regulator [Salegentibacter sp. JZCK2]|uniref:response regulator n=1 Tax=Salegentibacter tibetensis TaxID=2873600 RepID=UPI001CCCCE2E|nr:response regulator [Salegentibacter tibetensis]MBZ9730379.1 response regulator [Salegentibacter tibetensis]
MKKSNTKILVVDDDTAIGDMLKMLLEMNGYEVIVSEKPEETEENIITHGIDLVLLDMLISGVNGTDVCERIRREETTKHVTILMMSALHDAGKKCKAAGANDFIAKPFDMDELLEKIKILVQ